MSSPSRFLLHCARVFGSAIFLFVLLCTSTAQMPEWIWHNEEKAPAEGDVRFFRRTFSIIGAFSKAELQAASDGALTIFINGQEVGASKGGREPLKLDVKSALKGGDNVLAFRAGHRGGAPGAVLVLEIAQEYDKNQIVLTNSDWLSSAQDQPSWNAAGFSASGWSKAKRLAQLGDGPWGEVFPFKKPGATPAEELTVLPGYKVELLRSATPREGSWVAMTIDGKGRLYISPQNKAPEGGIMRVTLDERGQVAKTDWLKPNVGAAMGMLWAFDSLYVSGQGPDGQAIYRLRDTGADDELDDVQLFKKVPGGGGEHGAHALVLGPDGKSIYISHGNSTPLIDGISPDSPYKNYAEDDLLPRVMDPVATFFDKIKSPYGYILRTDENGTKWELFAGGFRNQYDIDFNTGGELFTYDSDMEWDVGLPWYRPTRVLHIVPGGEYGFREGSAKWPEWYPDSLPAAVNIGLGSPTGVNFGTRSNFPDKYRRAFFIMDWTFGRILAVHLQPHGSTYTAKNELPSKYHLTAPSSSADVEEFVIGKGLPVTDLEFGKDGAMYFITGGRGTQSGLYRVTWSAEAPKPELPTVRDSELRLERSLENEQLRELDRLLGKPAGHFTARRESVVGSESRIAALLGRGALERLPLKKLRETALISFSETPPAAIPAGAENKLRLRHTRADLSALLALARVGTKDDQEPLLKALAKFPFDSLSDDLKLHKLRVIKVAFARHGRPSDELVQFAIEKLGRQYPAPNFDMNRELCELLVWLGAPDVVEKTLALMDATNEQAEQIWYATCLREATNWTPAQREKYFALFAKAREFKGGNSLAKFILRIRDQALAKIPDAERSRFLALAEQQMTPKVATPQVVRQFQKAWTVAELEGDLPKVASGRNFARGKEIFSSTQCLACHKFGRDGGAVGPDLTAVSGRFSRRDILEAIIEPSKALSEQYAAFLFTTKRGDTLMAQVAEEKPDELVLITNALENKRESVKKSEIVSKEPSPVSLMPPALVNVLTREEILDLLAYIESGGNEQAPNFSHN